MGKDRRIYLIKTCRILLLLAILGLGAFLRLYELRDNPAGLFCDEALFSYNAYSILKTGRDMYGNKLPLLFNAFGIAGAEPVYFYSSVPSIAIFGLNEFGARFPSAFYGVLTILVTYLLAREMFNWKLGLLAAGLLAISPWHIHFSRIAFSVIALTFYFNLGLWLLYRGLSGKKFSIYLAGAVFGLCFYTYGVSRLFVPLFLLGFGLIYFKQLWKLKWRCLLGLLIFVLVSLPLVQRIRSDPKATARWRDLSILNKGDSIKETSELIWKKYLLHYSKRFLFVEGDGNPRHSVRGFGELYPCYIPFIWLGVALSILARKRRNLILLWWLVIFPIAASLTRETPTATRTLVGTPVFELLVAYSLYTVMHLLSMIRWRWVGYPIATAVFIWFLHNLYPEFKVYLRAYFEDYPIYAARTYGGFQYGYRDAINYMESQRDNYDLLMLTATDVNQPQMLILFYAPPDFKEYRRSGDWGYRISIPGEYGRYSLNKKVLYALRKEDLRFFDDYEIKKRIVAPDGKICFIIAEVKSRKEFIRDWLMLGLFDNTGGASLNKEYIDIGNFDTGAEYGGKAGKIRWHPYRPSFVPPSLNRYFSSQAKETGGNPENACAYLLTYIESPTRRKARLQLIGSEDHVSVWLNKVQLVRNYRFTREQDEKIIEIELQQGTNELLLKSCESIGGWYLAASIADIDSHPIKDLRFTTKPSNNIKPP